MSDSSPRWSTAVRTFHWVSAVLVLACVTAALVVHSFPKADRREVVSVHLTLGLSILLLTLARLMVRSKAKAPEHGLPLLMDVASKGLQATVYVLLLLLPVLGYVAVSSFGQPIHTVFFGLNLPPVPHITPREGGLIISVHKTLAWVLIWSVTLHACAALFHHFVRKDGVLKSML